MITFSNWLKVKESSPATRIKPQAALGLSPPVADIFSRSTPPPWQVKRLKKALRKSHKKKKRKKHFFDEGKKAKPVNPEFDKFLKSVESLAKDVWELQLAKKKKDAKEKLKELLKKHKLPVEVEIEEDDIKKNKTNKKEDKKEDKKEKKNKDDKFKIKKVKVIKSKDNSKSVDD